MTTHIVKPNPWQNALTQLERVAEKLNLDPGLHAILAHPKRALEVSIPVRMDGRFGARV